MVPHWIGLDRAIDEFASLSEDEQRQTGPLSEPEVVAAEVVRLLLGDNLSGEVIAVRGGRPPYALDPARIDPHGPS